MHGILELKDDLSNLPKVLDYYESKIVGWEDHLRINNKNLEYANAEQPAYSAYYDQLRIEMSTIVKYLDLRVKRVRGNIYKLLSNNFSAAYTDRAKDKLIDCDPKYVDAYYMYLIAEELYARILSIVTQFEQRSYSLTNIVKLRSHDLEDAFIKIND